MKLIEKELIGKKNQEVCEDGYLYNDNFVAVVDGATDKTNIDFNGKKGGYIIKEAVLRAISTFDSKIDKKEALLVLNAVVQEEYKKYNLLERMQNNIMDRAACAFAIYSDYRKEIWVVGDCQILIDNEEYNFGKEVDRINSEMRSLVNNIYLEQGGTIEELTNRDIGREAIMGVLKTQSLYSNNIHSIYGYDNFDGIYEVEGKTIKVKNDVKQIILSSDGYPKLYSSLSESENYLATVLKEDPLLINKFLSTKGIAEGLKSFDDRVYLRFCF
jgi:glycerophosphoryl diester phosphodiesterase